MIGTRPIPPSIRCSEPVMKEASLEAIKVINFATSAAVPNLFKGIRCCIAPAICCSASDGKPTLLKIGVSMGPGLTVLTLIPLGANSKLKLLAKEFTAARVALYTEVPGALEVVAPNAEVRITDAPSFNNGMNLCNVKNTPFKFTPIVVS